MKLKKINPMFLVFLFSLILIPKLACAHVISIKPMEISSLVGVMASLPVLVIWVFKEIREKVNKKRNENEIVITLSEDIANQANKNIPKNILLVIVLYTSMILSLGFWFSGGNIQESQGIILAVAWFFQALINYLIIIYLLDIGTSKYLIKIGIIFWLMIPMVFVDFFILLIDSGLFLGASSFSNSAASVFHFVAVFFGIMMSTVTVWNLFNYSLKFINKNNDFIWVLVIIPYVFSRGFNIIARGGPSITPAVFIFLYAYFISILIFSAIRSGDVKYRIFSLAVPVLLFIGVILISSSFPASFN